MLQKILSTGGIYIKQNRIFFNDLSLMYIATFQIFFGLNLLHICNNNIEIAQFSSEKIKAYLEENLIKYELFYH